MFNKRNGTLYTGVTNDIERRALEHKNGSYPNSFSRKYGVNQLGYFEIYDLVVDAIAREKQIKGGSREDKIKLIESVNPDWLDLFEEMLK
jgi:putative endonuclease